MTGVRWTLAEAEQAAAEAIAAWFIDKYHADYLALCLNTGTEPIEWAPHAGHRAQAAANGERVARAVLDALGIVGTVTVTDGHLEQVGWECEQFGCFHKGEPWLDTQVPLYRVMPS